MHTQDRHITLPEIQPHAPAPITLTVTVPNQDRHAAPVSTRPAPVANWERFLAFLALFGTVAMVILPAGIIIGRNLSAAEINQATGAKAAAESALNANRAQIENFCKSVK